MAERIDSLQQSGPHFYDDKGTAYKTPLPGEAAGMVVFRVGDSDIFETNHGHLRRIPGAPRNVTTLSLDEAETARMRRDGPQAHSNEVPGYRPSFMEAMNGQNAFLQQQNLGRQATTTRRPLDSPDVEINRLAKALMEKNK